MFNWKSKLTLAATIVVGTLSFAPNANAGEGGIVGVASFNIGALGAVSNASVATAVGKTTAYGASTTTDDGAGAITTEALAAGTGAAITFETGNIYIESIVEESAAGLAIAQANELNDQDVSIDGLGGTVAIDN